MLFFTGSSFVCCGLGRLPDLCLLELRMLDHVDGVLDLLVGVLLLLPRLLVARLHRRQLARQLIALSESKPQAAHTSHTQVFLGQFEQFTQLHIITQRRAKT